MRSALAMLLLLVACSRPDDSRPVTPVPDVRQLKVFFAHQSVGDNLLDGVRSLAPSLRIEESTSPSALAQPGVVHTHIGANERPGSKLEAFEAALDAGMGEAAEVAVLKLCFVDFNATTDVEQLFAQYQASHQRLQARFPKLTLVHVTAPLTTVERGPRGFLKNRFGQGAWGERENVKRHQYNRLLRQAYQGKEPLFDLAALEAAGPKGPSSFERDGQTVPALAAEYSDDGGHLNARGGQVIARALLEFLSQVPRAR